VVMSCPTRWPARYRAARVAGSQAEAHLERMTQRAEWEAERGRKLGGAKPKGPGDRVPAQKRVNVTDLDSRPVKTQKGFIQGYNAQAVTTTRQIVIAAEIIGNGTDYGLLEPVVDAAIGELAAAGITEKVDVALADAGYWDSKQIEDLAARGIRVLVPPDGKNRKGSPSSNRKGPRYDFMRRVLSSDLGHELYRLRGQTIEPVFGQIKHTRRIDRFQRRGITACRSEWRLIATTHNLLKLWRAKPSPQPHNTPKPPGRQPPAGQPPPPSSPTSIQPPQETTATQPKPLYATGSGKPFPGAGTGCVTWGLTFCVGGATLFRRRLLSVGGRAIDRSGFGLILWIDRTA